MIVLSHLHPDPRNANACDEATRAKIKTHIQRTGRCQALTVRPHPSQEGHYILIDGHHRAQILLELGWQEAPVEIWEIDEVEAGVLLLTLNRLRGTDIPRKRAELIESLLPSYSLEKLSDLLPESTGELEGLLRLIRQDEAEMEAALKKVIEAEKESLPVPFGFMIPAADAPIVQQALARYGERPAEALVAICQQVLQA